MQLSLKTCSRCLVLLIFCCFVSVCTAQEASKKETTSKEPTSKEPTSSAYYTQSAAKLEEQISLQAKQTSLSSILQALHGITRVSILADGEPALLKVDVNLKGTVRAALDSIADTFDYKWMLSPDGVVLMNKRFKSTREWPQMHLAEMTQMAKDIHNALALAPIPDAQASPNPILKQLLQSLTPEQYRAITSPQPFYARDLQPAQYQLFVQSMWTFETPQALETWEELANLLTGFPTSYLNADPKNTHSYGTIEDGKEVSQTSIDISHIVRDSNGKLHNKRFSDSTIMDTETPLPPFPARKQTTDAISQEKAVIAAPQPSLSIPTQSKLKTPVQIMSGEVTITALTGALSKQTGVTITAAPYLRDRTVIVLVKDISAAATLSALCELHDWSLRETEPGQILLKRRILYVPHEVTSISRLIQNALPADLRSFLHVSRPSENRRQTAKPVASPDWEEFSARIQRRLLTSSLPMHELCASLSVKTLIAKDMPYARLTEFQKKQLLSSYIYDSLDRLKTFLVSDLPPRLINPANSVIHFDEKTRNFQGPGVGAYIAP